MVHGAAGRPLLHPRFGELVAVVVGQMDRAAGGGDVDQRRHGQQDRVDGIAGVPDQGQAREHAVDTGGDHHRHERLALEAEPADEEADNEREPEEDGHARLTGLVDRNVVDRRAAHVDRRVGDTAFGGGHLADLIDRAVEIRPGHVGEGQHQAGLAEVQVVAGRTSLDSGRRGADDRSRQPGNGLLPLEVERLLAHSGHGPRARLGRLKVERTLDPGGFLRGRKEFPSQHFQPRVCHRAAFPTDEDELLALEILPEKPVGLGLLVLRRQPAFDVVAVVGLRLDRPDDHHGQQEHQDRHDPDAGALVEVGPVVRHQGRPGRFRGFVRTRSNQPYRSGAGQSISFHPS